MDKREGGSNAERRTEKMKRAFKIVAPTVNANDLAVWHA